MHEQDPRTAYRLLDSSDERLREVSQEVLPEDITSPEVQGIIDTMLQIARGERDAGPGGAYMVGLAAPQLGIMKRIIVVDMSIRHGQVPGTEAPKPELTVFVNPEIIEHSTETYDFREGCFSYHAKDGIYAKVPRYVWVKVRAYDRGGEVIEFTADDYSGRIIQHETDHLDGIRYSQRLPEGAKLHKVTPNEMPAYRKDGWQNWQHEVSPDELD